MPDIKELNDEKLKTMVGGNLTSDEHIECRANVDYGLCVECGLCISSINCGAISINAGGRYVFDQALCTGCKKCFEICPAEAIYMGV